MAATDSGSTIPRRQLGRHLRQLREEAGLTVQQAADALEWSTPRIWRVEKGAVAMRSFDVRNMCQIYGAPEQIMQALVGLAKETKAKGWWHSYGEVVPDWFELFVGLEAAAGTIRNYQPEMIPGLLQTQAYAEELYRVEPSLTEEDVQRSVAVRLQRQKALTRPVQAPRYEVVLGEAALRRSLADRDAMAGQLRHLVEVGKRRNVSIRVLLIRAGLHRALTCGAFAILDFPSGRGGRTPEPSTVYSDSLTGALYLDKPHEVAAYSDVWSSLVAASLGEDDSMKLIHEYCERHLR
jgi:transcriptional regulator with XRE-family HTH domain